MTVERADVIVVGAGQTVDCNVGVAPAGLAVGPDGYVYATWLDARDDVDRAATCAYVGHSVDGGVTWAPNARLSTVASDYGGTPTIFLNARLNAASES